MWDNILARWHFVRGRYVHALAKGSWQEEQLCDWRLWSYFKLGMFSTVANQDYPGNSTQMRLAKAVALAAIDRREKADEIVHQTISKHFFSKTLLQFGIGLSPFLPETALRLRNHTTYPPTLHAALLMRTGQIDHARSVVSDAFKTKLEHPHPDLYLLKSNLEECSPAARLLYLNKFLTAHGIPPVRLCEASRPPSPCNVFGINANERVEGPLVSILMTTYNTGQRAVHAIRSILNQSYTNLELIVVDDGSQDDTPNIVRDLARNDNRMLFIRLEKNVGTYAAKSIGLQRARGIFVTCHDSDDWSHPTKIARQVKPLLDNPQLIATTSHLLRIDDDGFYYSRSVYPLMRINLSSVLFRRDSVLSKTGAWDCVRLGADSEFFARLRLVYGHTSIYRVIQPLTLVSHRPDSLMTSTTTGYSRTGISSKRLAYWEAWSRWHIDTTRRKETPRLPKSIG